MNIEEGMVRVAKLIDWCCTGVGGLLGLLAVAIFVSASSDKFMGFLWLFASLLFFGAEKAIAWVIRGFAVNHGT
jgi:hypothetical protein